MIHETQGRFEYMIHETQGRFEYMIHETQGMLRTNGLGLCQTKERLAYRIHN